jgi:hypothetical protein
MQPLAPEIGGCLEARQGARIHTGGVVEIDDQRLGRTGVSACQQWDDPDDFFEVFHVFPLSVIAELLGTLAYVVQLPVRSSS